MSMYKVHDKVRGSASELEEHYDKIYRYCYFKLRQRELAEDITQETFLHFFNHESYRKITHELPYLYTIARNLCIDEYRKKKPLFLSEAERLEDVGAEERMLTGVSVKLALAGLAEEERELLLLRYVNELPVSVISRMLKLSRYTVYRKTLKALKKLEEMLKEE